MRVEIRKELLAGPEYRLFVYSGNRAMFIVITKYEFDQIVIHFSPPKIIETKDCIIYEIT